MTQNKKEVKVSDCGILLRGYTKTLSEVDGVVKKLKFSINRAHELGFGRIIAAVPRDKDCGKTPFALVREFASSLPDKLKILNPEGDEHRDALNAGLICLNGKFTHFFIVSSKAIGYLNTANVEKVLSTFSDGALCSGLALRNTSGPRAEDEIYNGVLAGCISNIFAAWDVKALTSVDWFDSAIGLEEIAPIVRLIKKNSVCIAPVIPTEDVGLDISSAREEHFRNLSSARMDRQLQEAKRVGGSFQLIEEGILLGYPQ